MITFGYVQITKAKARRAIANFESIRSIVDEMAASYPNTFETLGVLVDVADGDMITINAEAANAIYWVTQYSHLAVRIKEPFDDTSNEERQMLLEDKND